MPVPANIEPYLHKLEDVNLGAIITVVTTLFSAEEIHTINKNPGTGIKASLLRPKGGRLTHHIYLIKERLHADKFTCLLRDERQSRMSGVRINCELILYWNGFP